MLERRNRVTSPTEFKSIIRTGRKVVCEHFLCYGSDSNEAKFGIIVSKKSGNAVVRNRIRRRTRAATRQLIDGWSEKKEPIKGLFVIRFRSDANEPSFAEIRDELEQAMIQHQKSNN